MADGLDRFVSIAGATGQPTFIIVFWPDIAILMQSGEARKGKENPGEARKRPGEARGYQKGPRIIQIHPWNSNIKNL